MSIIQISVTDNTVTSTIVSTSLITITPTLTSTPTITQTTSPTYFQDSNVIETLAIIGASIILVAITVIYKVNQYKNHNNALQVQIRQQEDSRIANQVREIQQNL
jgi:hypothetical protein